MAIATNDIFYQFDSQAMVHVDENLECSSKTEIHNMKNFFPMWERSG